MLPTLTPSRISQREVDGIFRRMLLEGANPKQAATPLTAATLGRLPRWKKVEPLVKSYLVNTLHLLGEAPLPASWRAELATARRAGARTSSAPRSA